jgi:phage I-like protein
LGVQARKSPSRHKFKKGGQMNAFKLDLPVFELPADLKDEFKILPYGNHITIDGEITFEFTPDDAQNVIAAFKDRGIDMLNDWEHQSISHLPGFEQFKAPDGRAPAAGWNGSLEARGDGLWATKVRWTPEAAEMLTTGKYRYFSPVLVLKGGHLKAIQSIGLTNEPRIKDMPAIAARGDLEEYFLSLDRLPREEITAALAIEGNASSSKILGAINTLKIQAASAATLVAELIAFKASKPAADARVKELEAEVAALAHYKTTLAEMAVDYAEQTGRIAPHAREQFLSIAKNDPAAALVAFKGMTAGGAVPVGRITSQTSQPVRDVDDPLTAFKSYDFSHSRMQVHHDILNHQRTNPGCSYADAYAAVQRKR